MSVTPVLNEEQRIGAVVAGLSSDVLHTRLVIDDGSTDGTAAAARAAGAEVISHPQTRGVGAAIRTGIQAALERSMDAVVITSGSGKTPTAQAARLVELLIQEDLDLVQGSRYVAGGSFGGNIPFQRQVGTRVYSACFSLLVGRRVADASSGFRAIHTRLFRDPSIRVDQPWLDKYELEPYLLYKTITGRHRWREAPVTIIYPPAEEGVPFTRMKAFIDWWRILRPAVLLRLGLVD